MTGQIIIGTNEEDRAQYIENLLVNYSTKKRSSDVLTFLDEDKLGIEETRKIKSFFSVKAYEGSGKIVIIYSGDQISEVAQNGLLKTFEELGSNDMVVIFSASTLNFLPTVMSRMQVVYRNQKVLSEQDFSEIEQLVSLDIEGRFGVIEKSNQREELLDRIIEFAETKVRSGSEWSSFGVEALKARKYQLSNGNVRAILEWLILKLPKNTK